MPAFNLNHSTRKPCWTQTSPQVRASTSRSTHKPLTRAELPKGSQIISTETKSRTFWGTTGRINILLSDASPNAIFIKTVTQENGDKMLRGEFESMKAMYEASPRFVPKPIAWGSYATRRYAHFFLCEYRNMRVGPPEPRVFAKRLAELHLKSESLEGKFGFHVTTYSGNLPQMVAWEESWEMFFAKNLRLALDLEIQAKGHDPEFDTLIPAIFDRVIPRLLRPLERDGRSVKPCLVHGDLWYANSGIDLDTDESIIYDACCFYAHNECKFFHCYKNARLTLDVDEFGQWRPICNRFGAEYLETYHSYVQISPPEEDYDGRLDLYKLCVDHSTLAVTNI